MRRLAFATVLLSGCLHGGATPSTSQQQVLDDATYVDFGLDGIEFGVLVYQLITGTPTPPRAPPVLPDAGAGRHWAAVPDAPTPLPMSQVDAGMRDAGSALEAYREMEALNLYPWASEVGPPPPRFVGDCAANGCPCRPVAPPLESCDDVDPEDITVGADFRCLLRDGVRVLTCGRLADAGWACHSGSPGDGG